MNLSHLNLSHRQKGLYLALEKGKFCYVSEATALNCHILSKATCHDMAKRGYRSFSINPFANRPAAYTPATKPNYAHTWDQHIITTIWKRLHPNDLSWLSQWLATTTHLSAEQRLIQFADELLLSDLCEGPLLICLNNIDRLLEDPSASHALLTWITYCYELRDTYLTYKHLSIAAFGTAIPAPNFYHSQHIVVFKKPHTAKLDSQSIQQQQQPTKTTPAFC